MAVLKSNLAHLAAETEHRSLETQRIVAALRHVVALLREQRFADGVLLVIDELGKLLEYATQRPDLSDVHLLQELAEATASHERPDLLVMTVLHQAFDLYVADVAPDARAEWSKVQGRFEDIAFQDPPDDLLRLLGQAIRHSESRQTSAILARAQHLGRRASELGLLSGGVNTRTLIKHLVQCAPIHPLSALVLVRLCRKFGQNHRSLFSFLTSQEPFGFQQYLRSTELASHIDFYGLPQLFDYMTTAFGNGLLVGEASSRWAEAQAALDQCAGGPDVELSLLKTIGVLASIGPHGELKASPRVLEFGAQRDRGSVRRAALSLTERGILVFRRHANTFAFWQGHDVDLSARLAEAKRQSVPDASLVSRVNALLSPRPIVAKRHSYESGTLRYFNVRYAGAASLADTLRTPLDGADGLLVLAVPFTPAERDQLLALASSALVRERPDVLIGISANTRGVHETISELERWNWVAQNTPDLAADASARREVDFQCSFIREHLGTELAALFDLDSQAGSQTTWFRAGAEQLQIRTHRSLSEELSRICDEVYYRHATIRNELVNRRALSSAAAAARRNVLEALLVNSAKERLGLQGYGPEVTIYESLLYATGIHRQETRGWTIGAPVGDASLLGVWHEIEDFLHSCELERGRVAALFQRLQNPPYGLTQGVVPLLFIAVVVSKDTEVALYEDGTFLPELRIDTVERLLRQPDRFEVRAYQMQGIERNLYRELLTFVSGRQMHAPQTLVAVVRPLYRFMNMLPPYARQTATISARAQAVRRALSDATEPDRLIFVDLPTACGIEAFAADRRNPVLAQEYGAALRRVFAEMGRCYDELLTAVQEGVYRALGASGADKRSALQQRAARVAAIALEARTKTVAQLFADAALDDVRWIEAVAAMIAGKPPRTWSDGDRDGFEVNLAAVARAFRHGELVASTRPLGPAVAHLSAEILRVGVTDSNAEDLEVVVTVPKTEKRKLDDAVEVLQRTLCRLGLRQNPDLALAALGTLARPLLCELVQKTGGPSSTRKASEAPSE